MHTHRTPRPLPHGSDWRVILEGKQGFSQARPEHSRMRKTHMLREAGKGVVFWGKDKEEQCQEMGQEGQQGLGYGVGGGC